METQKGLPRSDSVAVSVLEAMAHGCVPLLSDLPANRELVRSGENGLILADGATLSLAALQPLQSLRDIFHYHFINAQGSLPEVQARIIKELQYQSSLELSEDTYDLISPIPLASQIVQHARQGLQPCQGLAGKLARQHGCQRRARGFARPQSQVIGGTNSNFRCWPKPSVSP